MVNNINGVTQAMAQAMLNKGKNVYHAPQGQQLYDSIQLSSDVMQVRSLNFDNARLDKIKSIRKELADGTYLTPEKLDIALDRALDDALKGL